MTTNATLARFNPVDLIRQSAHPFSRDVLAGSDLVTDEGLARALRSVLGEIPHSLPLGAQTFPLLDALRTESAEATRVITVIGAAIHRDADERRVAEYLLRHRSEVESGSRTALELVGAARCAAEMDVRHVRAREVPVEHAALQVIAGDPIHFGDESPAIVDIVVDLAVAAVAPLQLRPQDADHIREGVLAVLELAERHASNRGSGPSLLAMRPAARRDARLVNRLRVTFGDNAPARAISRLLIGADGTPIESALLWWAAQTRHDAIDIPEMTRCRWRRDIAYYAARRSQPSSVA